MPRLGDMNLWGVAMLFFLLAALAGYLACNPTSRWLTQDYDDRRRVAAVLLGLALSLLLFVQITGSLQNRFFGFIRLVALSPETTQAILGLVAGVMLRTLPQWSMVADLGGTPRLLVLAGAFGGVALVAIFAQNFAHLTVFETPYVKFQFATTQAEKQLDLDVQRDLDNFTALDGIVRTSRIVQYECGYAAVLAQGFEAFTEKPREGRYRDFGLAIAFREEILGFLTLIVNAERRGYDPDSLKRRVSVVADKFFRFVSEKSSDSATLKARYREALDELEIQKGALTNLGVPTELERTPAEKVRDKEDPSPPWCAKQTITDGEHRNLIDNTRFVPSAVAVMFGYTGNTVGAIKAYSLAEKHHPNDINVNASLAEALYVAERDFDEASARFEAALAGVETEAAKVEEFCSRLDVKKPIKKDLDICEKLKQRYKRARLNIKLRLAYLWAQEGVRASTAHAYAKESYEAFQQHSWTVYQCLDDYEQIYVQDTYAYVKLSFQARNFQLNKVPLDLPQIREARWLLEEAISQLRQRDRKDFCFEDERSKLWLRRLRSHLKLADAMLR